MKLSEFKSVNGKSEGAVMYVVCNFQCSWPIRNYANFELALHVSHAILDSSYFKSDSRKYVRRLGKRAVGL